MKSYIKYAGYVFRHCYYVRKMCWKNGLYWQGLVHDLSKWRPRELIPYTRHFYGNFPPMAEVKYIPHLYSGKTKEDIDVDFDRAWLYHQKLNPHHWQYWVLIKDRGGSQAMRMPEKYVKEMICDWWGAGMALGKKGKTKDWYEDNKEQMILHPETREYVEKAVQNSLTPYLLP